DLGRVGAHLAVDRLVEEILLRISGQVDGALGDAGVLGDLIDRGLLEAETGEEPRGRAEDALFLFAFHVRRPCDQHLNPVSDEVNRFFSLARDAQPFASEGRLSAEGKGEGMPGLEAGRIEELRRLEASERALADAFIAYARTAEGGGRLLHLSERHR